MTHHLPSMHTVIQIYRYTLIPLHIHIQLLVWSDTCINACVCVCIICAYTHNPKIATITHPWSYKLSHNYTCITQLNLYMHINHTHDTYIIPFRHIHNLSFSYLLSIHIQPYHSTIHRIIYKDTQPCSFTHTYPLCTYLHTSNTTFTHTQNNFCRYWSFILLFKYS